MNTKELTYLLRHPSELTGEHLDALEKLTRAFPYFQSPKALLLKGLKDQESFRYNQELKKTAAYTTDRSVLFDFITESDFDTTNKERISKKKKDTEIEVVAAEEIKVAPWMSMDDAVSMQVKEAEEVLDPSLFSSKENPKNRNISIAETLIKESEKTEPNTNPKIDPTVELHIEKPLDFNKNETHSFTEWLQLMSATPIQRTSSDISKEKVEEKADPREKEEETERKNKFDIIDNFISNNPKIKPSDKTTVNYNLAKESIVAPDELMTETLARVYLAQNKYKKAIQAYKILILKNPEKSGFFADQIKAIKKLQENK